MMNTPFLCCWPTRNRPNQLVPVLHAWRQAFNRFGIRPYCLVLDCSDDKGTALRAPLRNMALNGPGEIYHVDDGVRKRLARALADEVGPGATFALGTASSFSESLPFDAFGVARNLSLLLCAGNRFLTTDDDVFPDFRVPLGAREGAFESDAQDSTTIWPYLDEEGLAAVSRPDAIFPGDVYRDFAFDGYLDSLAPTAACFGYWGDSGMPSSSYLLGGRSGVAAEAYAEEAYHTAIKGRSVVRAAEAIIGGGMFFMGMHALINAIGLIPPFSPLGRGEDGLWGACIAAFDIDGSIAQVPYCVHHSPAPRVSRGREGAIDWAMNLNSMLLFLLPQKRLASGNDAYRNSGTELAALGRQSTSGLRDLVASILMLAGNSRIASLEHALESYDSFPYYWASDVEDAISGIRETLSDLNPLPPPELVDFRSFGDYLCGMGEMLQAWPETMEAAKSIGPRILAESQIQQSEE